jgi:hypothetical protein
VSIVILQPAASAAAQRHYADTIEHPVRFADYPQLDASDRNVLTGLYPSGSAPL